eukprot:gb/GFBE01040626.1/.p1 GENE.gb/GFBE01040626.1/~~gb/GFBE01040626.1/.p1  ORF type:complete len:282 (+),score=52.47 gb/GFBE01040626.1/:1-846(+)
MFGKLAGRFRRTPASASHLPSFRRRTFSASSSTAARLSVAALAFGAGALTGGIAVFAHVSQPNGPSTAALSDFGLHRSDPVHPYRRTMYLMRGVPGSGKSTVAHNLLRRHLAANGITGELDRIASLSRGFILSTDDFFSEIDQETGQEKTVFDVAQLKRNHERNQKRCELAMELGVTPIILDNTNTCAWEMRGYVELAKANGYQVVIKDVMAMQELSLDVVKERVASRAEQTGKEVPVEALERMVKRYEKLPPDTEEALALILKAEPPWAAKKTAKPAAGN